MTEDIDKYLRYFLILSFICMILFMISAVIINSYRSLAWNLIWRFSFGIIGLILIIVSTGVIFIEYKTVNYIFMIYITGVGLIIFNLCYLWLFSYWMYSLRWVGYILGIISLIGFIAALYFLKKVKYLFGNGILSSIKRYQIEKPKGEVDKFGEPVFPPILTEKMRYCENCQKYVRPYKFSFGHILFFIFCLCLPGIIVLILESLIRKKNKCPNCKKKVSSRSPTPEEIEVSKSERARAQSQWGMPQTHPEGEYQTGTCPECGAMIGSDSKYCEHCGKDLTNH